MTRQPNLNAYLYFETVARRGTVTRAAEELSVSPSAVSQQIKLLEQQLGVKLFRRGGRQLSLTLEGEQLFQASGTALRMLRAAQQGLGKTRENRRLNLRVTPSFGVRWLGPRLSDFVARHPDWDLRVDAAPDPTDFEAEIMDLDIRSGTGAWSGFHMAPVVQDQVLPLASPGYLSGLAGEGAARLDGARLIDSARALCKWDFWLFRNGLETEANRKSVLMDRSTMALQLALDGAGIVLESLALAARDVAAGRLVPVTPERPVLSFPAYWALCPPRYLNRRAVKLFLAWIDQQVAEHQAAVVRIVAQHGLRVEEIDAEGELSGA
ncbi:LysR substrate-binding domain-containing protein [Marimonas arenosa]|uniref:LysR substrate-binding domain-containing protein n=1 Tax=Marimonas arenosa TaxID=1795305 RepID=A0AAE3WA09_9RHOB|nr:LysR substrate-binding domain-containing protein [Marimonas arenosa]MDQ2088872.1 LysR substrate-binding domain-containing protein [Marimonas arenosa]